jgi:hypothetical protein
VGPPVFITYSSKDQKVARTICTALENRGIACWISSRDVEPGQNFQEQIVKAIRASKTMVLVFTANANNSNEIKKELALASQNNLVVIPVRIEDVTPNEAFAYEFATRQWIDLFDDWENSIAHLVELIAASIQSSGNRAEADSGSTGIAAAPPGKIGPASLTRRPGPRLVLFCGLAVVVAAAIAYGGAKFAQRPSPVSATATKASPTPSAPPAAQPIPAPVATTAQTDPPGSYEPATNREGITVKDFNLGSPDARLCQSLCIKEPLCTAWVYRDPQGRTDGQPHCWLRNNVVKMKGDNLTISGDVQR